MMMTYTELCQFDNFFDRFRYLKLGDRIGDETFGYDRYINQIFYRSKEWRQVRRDIIIRDNGCDLAIEDRVIYDRIIVHHINPLSLEQIEEGGPELFDLRNLVCVSHNTHNAIHYGDESLLIKTNLVERTPNDTCPWK